jgi:hypothetical protein
VIAVSQKTGELAWAEPIGEVPRKKGETVSAPPIYARGRVYVGLANGDWAMRGRVVAPRFSAEADRSRPPEG